MVMFVTDVVREGKGVYIYGQAKGGHQIIMFISQGKRGHI